MQALIEAQQLGKQFARIPSGQATTLQEQFVRLLRPRPPAESFWALRRLDFQVFPGEMVGVIGANGAGKSTLLRILGGVILPSEGRVSVRGRMSALIDLGTGFHPDLTGRDNLFINAIISGLTRAETIRQYDAIVQFAELEASMENPLHTFSAGMWLRLAFAIAVHVRPEVLLVDEVLAVGDQHFQAKCLQKIEAYQAAGSAIVLVSHDLGLVRQMCGRVYWLRPGCEVVCGPAQAVVDQYLAEAPGGGS